MERIRKHAGRACELRRYRIAHFIERIPFKREKRIILRAALALQMIEKPGHPRTVAKFGCAFFIVRQNLLKAWAAKFHVPVDMMNFLGPLLLHRAKDLRRDVLAVVLYTL